MKIMDLLDEISYPHASIDDTVGDIQKIMRRDNLDYLPLLDAKGKIFGIVDSGIERQLTCPVQRQL
jgi:CBS domain-containing protein